MQADTGVRASWVPRHTPESKNQCYTRGERAPKTWLRRRNQRTKDHAPCPFQIQTSCSSNPVCPPRNGEKGARLPDNCVHPPTLLLGVPAPPLPLESGSGPVGTHPKLALIPPHPTLEFSQQPWVLGSHFREVEAEACRELWTIRGPEPVAHRADPKTQTFGFLIFKWKLLVGKKKEWVGSFWNSDLWVYLRRQQAQVCSTEMT